MSGRTKKQNRIAFENARRADARRKPDPKDRRFDQLLCGNPDNCSECLGITNNEPGAVGYGTATKFRLSDPPPSCLVDPPGELIFYGFPDTGYRIGGRKRIRRGAVLPRRPAIDPLFVQMFSTAFAPEKNLDIQFLHQPVPHLVKSGERVKLIAQFTPTSVGETPPPCWIWCPRCGMLNRVDHVADRGR